jgi:hypothetical protein
MVVAGIVVAWLIVVGFVWCLCRVAARDGR